MPIAQKLQERLDKNEKRFLKESGMADATERARADFEKKHGYDPRACVESYGFTLPRHKRILESQYKLSEAVVETQLFSLTSFMVNDAVNASYQAVPVIYRSIADIAQAKTSEVSYVVLQGGDVPHAANETEEFTEVRASGYLVRARIYRFGKVVAYSDVLEEDDQTGEIKRWAEYQGDLMPYAEERQWVVTLFSAYQAANVRASGINGGIIPPMNIAGQAPSGYGGPTLTASAPTQAALEGLYEAVPYVTDASGNLSLVKVDTIVCAEGADEITFEKILQSFYNTTAPSSSGGPLAGILMKNVMEGKLGIAATRFVQYARAGLAGGGSNPWGVGQAGRIGTFINRTPLSVVTEASNAGRSFDTASTRIRLMRRFGATVRMPEFFLAGN
jgi:hypothetical protein